MSTILESTDCLILELTRWKKQAGLTNRNDKSGGPKVFNRYISPHSAVTSYKLQEISHAFDTKLIKIRQTAETLKRELDNLENPQAPTKTALVVGKKKAYPAIDYWNDIIPSTDYKSTKL